MTVSEISRLMRGRLAPVYGDGEAAAMVRLVFYALRGWNATQLVINGDLNVPEHLAHQIDGIVSRLLRHEPIQYILGVADFYGMRLKVTQDTLIPRPETEQLVDMIVDRYRSVNDLRVLDVGTGSGAIAIALARNLPFPQVTAIDISEEALGVAKENATALKAKVVFINEDIFRYDPEPKSFDIIVSNPPYIDESEKDGMERNVLYYEPHTALFVPDSNPLIFYSRIVETAGEALAPGGSLWFEINPRHVDALVSMIRKAGFSDVRAIKDIHGRDRFVSALKIYNGENR